MGIFDHFQELKAWGIQPLLQLQIYKEFFTNNY